LEKLGNGEYMKITLNHIKELKKNLNIKRDVHILGVRASVSSNYGEWLNEIEIDSKRIDYESMACSFIVFKDDKMMILQGSTIPHIKYLTKALQLNGNGSNQLECGFYKSYARGLHYPSEQTAHQALRQTKAQPIRRSSDNLSFDSKDRIEIANVHDNIHAAWCNVDGKTHASAGCQVIAGYPECKKRKNNTSHWKLFHDHIYSLPENEFNYLLVNYWWLERTVNKTMKSTIIYGSESDQIKKIQHYFHIFEDGIYLKDTYQHILKFQASHGLVADGIIGEQTLKQIGSLI